MIVVDIETSGGFNPSKYGIWQIGALELENPDNTFLEEAHLDVKDEIDQEALKVIGKTEQELRDSQKQTQKELLEHFFLWANKQQDKNLIAHNTPFDFGFLSMKSQLYGLQFPFPHRSLDLHTLAAIIYFQINGIFFTDLGVSKMNLTNILKFCGLPDNRIQIEKGNIKQPGTPHNGLEDAQCEAECWNRLLHGKPLLEKFNQFPIPPELIKK